MTKITKRFNIALLASLVATTVAVIPQVSAAQDANARGGHRGGADKMFARLDTNADGDGDFEGNDDVKILAGRIQITF